MGAPNNYLIPPAVLFLNPGITREKFVELLDNTHSSFFIEYKPEKPWDYFDAEKDDFQFHEGIGGLAEILGLQRSAKYKELQKEHQEGLEKLVKILGLQKNVEYKDKCLQKEYDESDLLTSFYLPHPRGGPEHEYNVNICEKKLIGESEIKEYSDWSKPKIGEIWQNYRRSEAGLIIEIINGESYEEKEEDFPELHPYTIKIKPLSVKFTKQKFKTQEDLWKKWPQLNPNFIYNWEQNYGNFAGHDSNIEKFLWMREGDKYSINPKTYEILLDAPDGEKIYSNFILTVEAIKRNAWKVLSYNGIKYVDSFLKDFPEVKSKHEHAIWDSSTSSFAKKDGMTLTELLRLRNQGF